VVTSFPRASIAPGTAGLQRVTQLQIQVAALIIHRSDWVITVLVKEVFATDHAQLTTGDAHWATGTKVWFVMIKDDKGRYPGNPLWGDGWGWAL
jgi:hypothetical protein